MANIIGGTPTTPFYNNQNAKMAKAVVEAWKNPTYRDELLTFPTIYGFGQVPTAADYARTGKALQKFQINMADKKVVVLLPAQYAIGYQKVEDEVVFVLPDPLVSAGFELPGAETAIAVTPLGM